jgi:hypothetical protein
MARRYLSRGLALVSAAAVSGCNVEETPQRCIERFEAILAGSPINGAGFRDARVQPVFTYDITHMDNALETLVGKGEQLKSVRVTISHGADGGALDAFYRAEVPPDGAIFAADGFSLYRVNGTPGTRHQTLAAGCRGGPAKAPLTHIQWISLPQGAEDLARTP